MIFIIKEQKQKKSKKSPQYFNIRDLCFIISSLNINESNEAILCFYGSRYEKNLINNFKNF